MKSTVLGLLCSKMRADDGGFLPTGGAQQTCRTGQQKRSRSRAMKFPSSRRSSRSGGTHSSRTARPSNWGRKATLSESPLRSRDESSEVVPKSPPVFEFISKRREKIPIPAQRAEPRTVYCGNCNFRSLFRSQSVPRFSIAESAPPAAKDKIHLTPVLPAMSVPCRLRTGLPGTWQPILSEQS